MNAVSNASPLISLARIGSLDKLPSLYEIVHLPTEVYNEVVVAGVGLPGAAAVAKADWIQVTPVHDQDRLTAAIAKLNLGAGELAAVFLAKGTESASEPRPRGKLDAMSRLVLDTKLAVRGLRRKPWAVAGAVVSLALGFAAQIVVLSCVNAVLWKPLAVPDPSRVVTIYGHSKTIGSLTNIAYPHLDRLASLDVFEAVAAFTRLQIGWETGQGVEKINVEMVSENYFDVLRPRLRIGRAPREAGEVLLGYDFWNDRFGGDVGVVGRTVTSPAGTFTITGVAASDFRGTLMDYLGNPKVWLTLRSQNAIPYLRGRDLRQDWVMNWFVGAARLRPGVTVEQAQQAVSALETHSPIPVHATPRSARVFAAGKAAFHPSAKERVERTLALCAGLAGLLLFLGCLNAGVFLVGKALGEVRQSAMERALGAGAAGIARRRFLEAAMLCGVAVLAGTVCAGWWVRLLEAFPPPLAMIVVKPAWDWRVWALTLGWTVLAIAGAGAAPALVAMRGSATLQSAEAGSSRGARRLREVLVASQVAVAAAILVAAGFVLRTVEAAHSAQLGFNASGLTMAEVDLFGHGVDAGKRAEVVHQVLALLRARAEVEEAASASLMPLTVFRIPGRLRDGAGASFPVYSNGVSESYFRTLQLPLQQGRVFAEGKAGAQETVVNETLARTLDARGDVLGRMLDVLDEDAKPRRRLTIVGVARDAKYHTLWQDKVPYYYVSSAVEAGGSPAIVVRSRASREKAWEAIRETVRSVVPAAAVAAPRTPDMQLTALIRDQSYLAAFFGALGGIAVIVAAGGLMASLYLMVGQRTREIGIRQALGATRAGILRVVLVRGLSVAGAGLAVGVLAGGRMERWLRPLAPGTREGDPWPMAGAFAVLFTVAMAAALAPALRAARIEPWMAIRHRE